MNEIEVKVLGINIEKVKQDVLSLGGIMIKKENQENYIYELPQNLKNRNGYLRIRHSHDLINDKDNVILGTKVIISQGRSRVTEEHEVEVSDLRECMAFLDALELKFHRQQNKYRESYTLLDCLIEFDTWEKEVFPEPYMEIEAEDQEKIFELLSLLGIPYEKATSKSIEQIKSEMGL